MKRIFLLVFIICLHIYAYSQVNAEEKKTNSQSSNEHSPRKAAIYSAILPGLGQAYNKKYWKIPIVYGAIATSTYFIQYNYKNYVKYKDAYLQRIDGNPNTNDPFIDIYEDEAIKTLRDYHRRNMELSVITLAGVYILNIIDASVDAHLFNFDVSDKLSFNIKPDFLVQQEHIIFRPYLNVNLKF